MIKKRPSKQDRFKKQIFDDFVGRDEPIALFRLHLDAKPGDNGFYDIFNVFGQGGVGKTHLTKKFRALAQEKGVLTTYTDENIQDSLQYMQSVAEQLEKQGISLKGFSERYKKFLQEKQLLEADPDAPKGLLSLFTSTLVKGGLEMAEEIPVAGVLVRKVDTDIWGGKAGELAEYIKKRLTNKDEVQLLLDPLKVLTPLFLEDLMKITEEVDLHLYIDTYEETSIFLDEWLRDVLNGKYGDIPDNLVLIISGRAEVSPNEWASFNPFKRRLSLESFTEDEAVQFLNKKNISNPEVIKTILELSLRLPIMLAMLADKAPSVPEEVANFSRTAVDRFLRWIKDPVQRQLALYGALPRQLNQDIIKRLIPEEEDSISMFNWLIERPFVQTRSSNLTYHPVVRDLMLRYIRQSSLEEWERLHKMLADYYDLKAKSLGIEDRVTFFQDEAWQLFTLEKCYHSISHNPKREIPESIRNFVATFRLNGFNSALPWVEIIYQAGKICDDLSWGDSLQNGMKKLRDEKWESALEMASKINNAGMLIDEDDQGFLYWLEGVLNFLSNNKEKAIECYQKATDIKPDKGSAWYDMSILYGQLGNMEKAIECYQKATEIKPDNDSAWHYMGIAYAQLGIEGEAIDCYQKAIDCYQKAIEINPNNDSVLYNMGVAHDQLGNEAIAIEYYQKVTMIKPDKDSAWHNMGAAYIRLGKKEEAIKCYQKAIEIKSDKDLAWYNMGIAYGQLDNLEEAINCYQKATEINPGNDSAWHNMSVAHDQLGNEEEAFECYRKASEIRLSKDIAFLNRGIAHDQLGMKDEAIECYQKAVQINPNNDLAWYNMGIVHGQQGNEKKAIECYQKVTEIKPDKDSVWYNMGNAYNRLGKKEEAIDCYRKAVEIKPNNASVWCHMSIVYDKLGMKEEAIACYQKAIEIMLAKGSSWLSVGMANGLPSKKKEATESYQTITEIKSGDDSTWCNTGIANVKVGNMEEAIECFQKAISINPNNELAWYYMNVAYGKLGDVEEAFKCFHKYNEINSDNESSGSFYMSNAL